MKKFISGLSALALAGMMTMTAFATAAEPNETTINPKGGEPFDIAPDPESANTTVTYSVEPSYTVKIPAKVALSDSAPVTADIVAEEVKLMSTQRIVVSIAEASEFKITAGTAELSFTLSNESGTLSPGSVAAEFRTPETTMTEEEKKAALTETLTFGQIDATGATYAGDYTGTLTFNISVETSV